MAEVGALALVVGCVRIEQVLRLGSELRIQRKGNAKGRRTAARGEGSGGGRSAKARDTERVMERMQASTEAGQVGSVEFTRPIVHLITTRGVLREVSALGGDDGRDVDFGDRPGLSSSAKSNRWISGRPRRLSWARDAGP